MKKRNLSLPSMLLLLLPVFLTIGISACSGGNYLKPVRVDDTNIEGTYRVIKYGYQYLGDPETVYFFDKEGDRYVFEFSTQDWKYTVKEGVPGKEALETSEFSIRRHSYYLQSMFKKIVDTEGEVIGYELRPLYQSMVFGRPDMLEIHYRIERDKVIVSVQVREEYIDRDAYY